MTPTGVNGVQGGVDQRGLGNPDRLDVVGVVGSWLCLHRGHIAGGDHSPARLTHTQGVLCHQFMHFQFDLRKWFMTDSAVLTEFLRGFKASACRHKKKKHFAGYCFKPDSMDSLDSRVQANCICAPRRKTSRIRKLLSVRILLQERSRNKTSTHHVLSNVVPDALLVNQYCLQSCELRTKKPIMICPGA